MFTQRLISKIILNFLKHFFYESQFDKKHTQKNNINSLQITLCRQILNNTKQNNGLQITLYWHIPKQNNSNINGLQITFMFAYPEQIMFMKQYKSNKTILEVIESNGTNTSGKMK